MAVILSESLGRSVKDALQNNLIPEHKTTFLVKLVESCAMQRIGPPVTVHKT